MLCLAGNEDVSASLKLAILSLFLTSSSMLVSPHAHAQWWTAAPADFEDCAERATKTSSRDNKDAALSACESKFAGRRKLGGGYTYYDFMQNRSFDIVGPNPTTAEQRAIDEQYANYLDGHRRSIIVAAFAERQREIEQQAAQANNQRDITIASVEPKAVALPRPRPRLRVKGLDCSTEPISCGWSKLSTGLKDFKDALFGGTTPAKSKRI
jgi:hypothetical protein